MRRASAVPALLVPALATAVLAGCAGYRAAPISPAGNAAALEARSLADARLQEFVALGLGEQRGGSWDLARLTLAALYFHPDLDLARSRLAAARAAVTTAQQRPNPTLNLAAVFGTAAAAGAIPPGAAPLTIGPIVDFVIETAGKRGYRTARARHLAEAARADLSTAAWQVRGRVRAALLDLWAARRRLSLMQRRLALQDQLVGLLQSRFAAGAASSLDLARERIGRAQLALAARDVERAAADAHARLAAAIGVPASALDGAAISFAAFDRPAALPDRQDLGALRGRALDDRADIRAALAEYEAAQSALQLEYANQYPNLTLGPGYEYDFGVNKYVLSPAAMLPLFNQNQGPIAQAAAERDKAAAAFTALQARIIGAIDRAGADYRAALAAFATAGALVADARGREEQISRSFAAGEADRPTLVTAQLEVATTELSRQEAEAEQRRALGLLEDALQHPFFDAAAPFPRLEANPRPSLEPGP